MNARKSVKLFSRAALALMILAILALAVPGTVSAAAPSIKVITVKADDSVTLRTTDSPKNITYTVRMDKAGNKAIDGIVVGQINSGAGGTFDVTYRIPAELKGTLTIAIRVESAEGYYAYDWFNNRSGTSVPQPTPTPGPATGTLANLTFPEVKANTSVVVEMRNLPANTSFTVRVGPFYTFSRNYVYTPSITTDSKGYANFTIQLPDVVKNVELIAVRVDGGGHYAYNAFKNVNASAVVPVTSTTGRCQVISVTPGTSLSSRSDFDTVWEIKNVSGKTWDGNSVDYKYVSGTKMQKRGDYFDLHQTIKDGETVKVLVDMIAPADKGTYTSNWALVQGGITLCNLPVTVRVK